MYNLNIDVNIDLFQIVLLLKPNFSTSGFQNALNFVFVWVLVINEQCSGERTKMIDGKLILHFVERKVKVAALKQSKPSKASEAAKWAHTRHSMGVERVALPNFQLVKPT